MKMKKSVLFFLMALALNAKAQAGGAAKPDPAAEALMKKSDCFSCHQVKMKVVGPSYRDVAKKYKGNKAAEAQLVKKVKEGGAGNWGSVPMAAHPGLKDEEVKAMVKWVLAQK
jgi:cytochrome c